MTEKWLLVLLIVGGTSLIFFICFPIDFYLYRRRKRKAREHTKFPNFEPKPAERAGQCHANVEIKESIASVWADDIRRKNMTKGGFARIVSMIRKKQQEEKMAEQSRVLPGTSAVTKERDVNVLGGTPETGESYEFPENGACCNEMSSVDEGGDSDAMQVSEDRFPMVPRRKFSNLSAAWNENEELFDRENRCLNYGALQRLDDSAGSLLVADVNKQHCYSIPLVPQSTMMFVKSSECGNTPENNTESDEICVSSPSEHRYSPNDHKQEFKYPVNSYEQVKYSKMVAKFTSESNLIVKSFGNNQRSTSDSSSEDALTEPAMNRSVSRIISGFGRSASDQSMFVSRDSRHMPRDHSQSSRDLRGYKNGRKLNSVNPTDRIYSSSVEQFVVHEAESSHTSTSKKSRSRKKMRKKKSFLKKHSSDSCGSQYQKY